MCGVGALRGAEDAGAHAESGLGVPGWCGEDCAGEFGAADPGERGLVLVFALDLENVEEVGARGVNLDQVFVC